jgi:outer membrane protein OmpA-like peptidoglycan-associated protein
MVATTSKKRARVRIFASLSVLGLIVGCTQTPTSPISLDKQTPVTRLEFTQRRVIPDIQTVRLPSSFEHVAVADTDESPQQITAVSVEDAAWSVTEKGAVKPTKVEAVAGLGIHNGIVLNVLFDSEKSDIDKTDPIKELATKLNSVVGSIAIVGFTDRSIAEFHREDLGLLRAQVVASQLVKFGVKKERISTVTGGISKLYADDNKNRRASIFLRIN